MDRLLLALRNERVLRPLRRADRRAHRDECDPCVGPDERHADQDEAVVASRDQEAAPAHHDAAGETPCSLDERYARVAESARRSAADDRAKQQGEHQENASREISRMPRASSASTSVYAHAP